MVRQPRVRDAEPSGRGTFRHCGVHAHAEVAVGAHKHGIHIERIPVRSVAIPSRAAIFGVLGRQERFLFVILGNPVSPLVGEYRIVRRVEYRESIVTRRQVLHLGIDVHVRAIRDTGGPVVPPITFFAVGAEIVQAEIAFRGTPVRLRVHDRPPFAAARARLIGEVRVGKRERGVQAAFRDVLAEAVVADGLLEERHARFDVGREIRGTVVLIRAVQDGVNRLVNRRQVACAGITLGNPLLVAGNGFAQVVASRHGGIRLFQPKAHLIRGGFHLVHRLAVRDVIQSVYRVLEGFPAAVVVEGNLVVNLVVDAVGQTPVAVERQLALVNQREIAPDAPKPGVRIGDTLDADAERAVGTHIDVVHRNEIIIRRVKHLACFRHAVGITVRSAAGEHVFSVVQAIEQTRLGLGSRGNEEAGRANPGIASRERFAPVVPSRAVETLGRQGIDAHWQTRDILVKVKPVVLAFVCLAQVASDINPSSFERPAVVAPVEVSIRQVGRHVRPVCGKVFVLRRNRQGRGQQPCGKKRDCCR